MGNTIINSHALLPYYQLVAIKSETHLTMNSQTRYAPRIMTMYRKSRQLVNIYNAIANREHLEIEFLCVLT